MGLLAGITSTLEAYSSSCYSKWVATLCLLDSTPLGAQDIQCVAAGPPRIIGTARALVPSLQWGTNLPLTAVHCAMLTSSQTSWPSTSLCLGLQVVCIGAKLVLLLPFTDDIGRHMLKPYTTHLWPCE